MNAVLREHELDGAGAIFGWKFSDGGSTGLVTFYIEDDENWHPKFTVDRFWLVDLESAAKRALTATPTSAPATPKGGA